MSSASAASATSEGAPRGAVPAGAPAAAESAGAPDGAAPRPGAPVRRGEMLTATALAVPLLALALTLGLTQLGARSLHGDEAIYANPASEAVLHGRWYPLTVRGLLYDGKPPLAVWPVALAFRWLGIGELADRLPSALAGVALVMLVYAFAAWLLGPWRGLLAATLLATCRPWLLRHGARDGVGDPLLCLLLTATLLLYLHHRTTGRRRWLLAAAACAALAGLVKDLVGPLFFLAIAAAWELLRTRDTDAPPNARKRAPHALAAHLRAPLAVAGLGLLPYLLWFADMARRSPVFLAHEHRNLVLRHTRGLAAVHVHGPSYYPAALGAAFGHWWPAVLAAPLAWWALRRAAPASAARLRAFLLLPAWVAVPLAMLALSASSLDWYLEPIYPPLAILIAAGCGEVARRLAHHRVLRAAFALAVAALASARASLAWQDVARRPPRDLIQRVVLTLAHLPAARLYLDDRTPTGPALKEWDHFYLATVKPPPTPLPAALPTGGCNVVLTAAPASLAARPDLAGARPLTLPADPPTDPALTFLDLCGGELLRRLPPR